MTAAEEAKYAILYEIPGLTIADAYCMGKKIGYNLGYRDGGGKAPYRDMQDTPDVVVSDGRNVFDGCGGGPVDAPAVPSRKIPERIGRVFAWAKGVTA